MEDLVKTQNRSNYADIAKAIAIFLVIIGHVRPDTHDIFTYKSYTPALFTMAFLFPIVWTILYVLMGYSSYVVMQSETIECKYTALGLYSLQLFVNFLWTIIFFAFKAYLIAFITLIVLWSLIIFMLIHFKRISRASFWLNIPYLLWITFAGYLNLEIVLLN